jgi:hypothetical protein
MNKQELQARLELAIANRRQGYKLGLSRDFKKEATRLVRYFEEELAKVGN